MAMVACGVSVEEAGSEESAETTNGERRVLASCLHPSSPERAQTSGKSAVRDSAQHGPSEENSEAHVSGPFRAGLLLDGTLHVSAAPLPPLLPSPPANVPLPVYEALSLLGSTAGLLLIAWPLSWSDSEAPWARQMASTSVTGGGMFVVATGSSCFLAAVLLWMTDFAATLLVIVQGRRSIATEVYKALNFLTRARTSVMKVEDSSGPVLWTRNLRLRSQAPTQPKFPSKKNVASARSCQWRDTRGPTCRRCYIELQKGPA